VLGHSYTHGMPTSHTADARVSTGQTPRADIGPLAYTTPKKKQYNKTCLKRTLY